MAVSHKKKIMTKNKLHEVSQAAKLSALCSNFGKFSSYGLLQYIIETDSR